MQIRIFWLWSEFSDCYPKKMLIKIFWLWSEVSDCDQNFLIVIRIFWLWSEVSDCDQKFLIVSRIFWLLSKKMQIRIFWSQSENFEFWLRSENSPNKRCFFSILFIFDATLREKRLLSEFSDHNQNFLIVIRFFWLWSNWEKNKRLLRNKQNRKTENNKQILKTILCFDRPPRHINPGIHSGILLSVIFSGVASGVLFGIKYGVLSGKSFAHFTWQKFWRSVWHTFWSDWWKVWLLKICQVWVSCRDHRFFLPVLVFTHRMEKQYDIIIAYIFIFGTGLEPGQVAGTLDMRSCAPSISTWHFGTLLRPPGNLKWGPNAYPTKKLSPTNLHTCCSGLFQPIIDKWQALFGVYYSLYLYIYPICYPLYLGCLEQPCCYLILSFCAIRTQNCISMASIDLLKLWSLQHDGCSMLYLLTGDLMGIFRGDESWTISYSPKSWFPMCRSTYCILLRSIVKLLN